MWRFSIRRCGYLNIWVSRIEEEGINFLMGGPTLTRTLPRCRRKHFSAARLPVGDPQHPKQKAPESTQTLSPNTDIQQKTTVSLTPAVWRGIIRDCPRRTPAAGYDLDTGSTRSDLR